MKICTIVGVRGSGKTTTVAALVRELKSRGHRVGTVKTTFCPGFSLDTPGSNSDRHRKAGADLVCIRGDQETDLILPPLSDASAYASFPVDFLLLEGDYELCVPRIICAYSEKEIEERMTEDVIAISGRIADSLHGYQGLPAFSVLDHTAALADYLEQVLKPVTFPIPTRKIPAIALTFHSGSSQKEKPACEMPDPSQPDFSSDLPTHLFLTGKKQVGKSTLLKKVREALSCPEAGFETRPYEINGQKKGYCLHSLLPLKDVSNDCPIVISVAPDRVIPVTETFETLGVEVLKQARETNGVIILDELGKAERKANHFCREVFRCLDGPCPVLGVLQADAGSFTEQVAAHPRVKVWEVTEENREELLSVLLEEFQR